MKLYNPFHKHVETEIIIDGEYWEYTTCAICSKIVWKHQNSNENWYIPTDLMMVMDDSSDILCCGLVILIFMILVALGIIFVE